MENYSVVIFIMAIMIGLSAVADKLRLSYPILLITAGIALGFIPGMPEMELNPEVIFLIFLPPLLYDAAFNISFKDFITNIHTINVLAVGLVFITAAGIAFISHYIIGMSWPVSFVLGAILSATDAVAAISITKGLKLSHNTTVILEGESLVNDASALVVYGFAIAAVTGSAFVLWKASLNFVVLMGGGFLVGFTMGKVLAFILARVKDNAMVTISFMLLMPFVTYRLAEELHVSGVIAVVMLGLAISRFSKKIFPEPLKQQSRYIWDIIIFLLNGLIFILIGLELPVVTRNIEPGQLLPYVAYAFLITIVALALRMARVFMRKINLERAFQSKKRPVNEASLLTMQESIIISWSGMRGIVSLAMAIALPTTLQDGSLFPERNVIIFISTAVVLFTILGQGLTLPWVVKKMIAAKK